MAVSPRLSFKGYSFAEALFRNKTEIKILLATLGGITTFIGFDWQNFFLSLGIGIVALGVKLIADAVDFYFTEVEI